MFSTIAINCTKGRLKPQNLFSDDLFTAFCVYQTIHIKFIKQGYI
ncbi:hypothetical protein HMPREF1051_2270 [Neisseria sicca VK64]|uniref:Uncharacterized protein n=1 Tax=Neisseria sicca VK64 TaxID=1095748 RepID=I2NCR5_NEISI|nr:hypothetical protein HMPREF1051_2270 [Neisseria sicca VK64]